MEGDTTTSPTFLQGSPEAVDAPVSGRREGGEGQGRSLPTSPFPSENRPANLFQDLLPRLSRGKHSRGGMLALYFCGRLSREGGASGCQASGPGHRRCSHLGAEASVGTRLPPLAPAPTRECGFSPAEFGSSDL